MAPEELKMVGPPPCASPPHNSFPLHSFSSLPLPELPPCPSPHPFSQDPESLPPPSWEVLQDRSAFSGAEASPVPVTSHFSVDPASPLPASGSHALTSGSHDIGARCEGPGAQNPERGPVYHAAPVTYGGVGGALRGWKPFSYQNKKQLCKAQREFGQKSEYFKGLLKATFSSNELVPWDIKDLFTCLLTPTEYLLWEQTWKRSLQAVLIKLCRCRDTAVDADKSALTFDHLCGEGNWKEPGEQARILPKVVLVRIMGAAENAFLSLPAPTPEAPKSYLTIKQAPNQSFIEFVDQIRAQVERQVENQGMHPMIILEVAKENANESCKRVISGMPVYPEPTLPALVEACMKKASTMDIRPPPRRPIPPTAMAVHPQTPAKTPTSQRPRGEIVCFYCQGVGHLARFCLKKTADAARERGGKSATTIGAQRCTKKKTRCTARSCLA
ncbi:endogenous retrovirus group K member 8 Gag polyprotein-like [Corvus moneduloides]|uniref:endogenous retrovirus group K member 8 Gag polyprotein-like n=1 Tax=Corvus moneduloides TaxID=1196302 RepID=UPI0013643707|nr:endogenous retrovirus group K member 8 Gag polyprotein-like [Corvus moneduloides]XP_031958112.1 endogenous retrovirus group K member 8 Gag polyprotein-like [Corvus moneduloides]XP_031958113.1 endogenous retrovirus group K member 8 Gag polyprotein-like [Corvus moneduloides]XP_031958114.1 endogenous retrovirus group K member 8 Gag polyprotein-like [Corvus moneduloides]XP_031958116.1 endogenous retrovirus group K member 8 Gag polyprotein-like [Corvus moneduloides]